jgi:PBP1b-binding outer membrane lipoprotein LpoB
MKSTRNNSHPSWPILFASLFLLAGCAQHHGYVDPSRENFYRQDVATLQDMKTAVAELVDKMQNDEGFQLHYELLASKKTELPVLQIGSVALKVEPGVRVTRKLASARSRLEIALRKTRLFDITDDAAGPESISEEWAESMEINADIGLKKGSILQDYGEHADADYQIYEIFRASDDGGRYTYSLELRLFDAHTGIQIWGDIADVEKE